MCKKSVVAYGDFIGKRMVGWCVFNGKDFSFLSDKQVKARIAQGHPVSGLTVDGENNVVIDKEFTRMLMGKSGLAFSPIGDTEDDGGELVMNKYYALVKVVKGKEKTEYHFITNRCGYEIFDEQQLKAMLEVLELGGVRRAPDGELEIHRDVEIAGATEGQNKAKGDSKVKSEGVG